MLLLSQMKGHYIMGNSNSYTKEKYFSLFIVVCTKGGVWQSPKGWLPSHQNFTLQIYQTNNSALIIIYITFHYLALKPAFAILCLSLLMLISPGGEFYPPFAFWGGDEWVSGLNSPARTIFSPVAAQSCWLHYWWLLSRQPIHLGIVLPFP